LLWLVAAAVVHMLVAAVARVVMFLGHLLMLRQH
jgi:hypothetical protein